ncbi:AAA family ATPase [Streptomyces sp. URMC 125]|uniref:AAA family ATPase n=1 Tax=Streptomyces sp. URMC 125 TaxID=3423419 RepID=UPI003F1BC2B1
MVACLTATPESLILLENPEAHLHPKGQSRMAALLSAAAATGAQLIVETHRDHVLNGVRIAVKQGALQPQDTVVHYFSGNGAGAEFVTPRIDRDGMLEQWPRASSTSGRTRSTSCWTDGTGRHRGRKACHCCF